jgi:hypothetical protein
MPMIKATLKLVTIFILYLVSIGVNAQEITCNSFCLTDVRMDTSSPNLMYVSLFFTGGNNDFINYPWIAEVINDQGDTVGVGTWNFFGQFGNTSNDYPVMVEFDTIPGNFNSTMVFHYDTSVCLLTFPCSMTGIEDHFENHQLSIYPNPFSKETTLHSERAKDFTINIFDPWGHLVKHFDSMLGSDIKFNRDGLFAGIYFAQFSEGKRMIEIRKLIIVD